MFEVWDLDKTNNFETYYMEKLVHIPKFMAESHIFHMMLSLQNFLYTSEVKNNFVVISIIHLSKKPTHHFQGFWPKASMTINKDTDLLPGLSEVKLYWY